MSELTLGFARRQGDVMAKRKYTAMMLADVYNPAFAPIADALLPALVKDFAAQPAGQDRSFPFLLHLRHVPRVHVLAEPPVYDGRTRLRAQHPPAEVLGNS